MTARHPMERHWSRRQFLGRAAGSAVAVPSLAAILAACSKPGEGSGGDGSPASDIPIATLDDPVTLPLNVDPIPADTPIESGPLIYYNWADYIYKKEIAKFEEKFGVEVEITTFNNMEEGIAKVESGQVQPDVFFPTKGYLRRLVQNDLVQPLQHELIPNIENMWPIYSDPGPYYDREWRYTVPYTIYTWGVAYRRDRVTDDEIAAQGWDALWNNEYEGEISLYNSYGDTIAVAILRNGSLEVNTDDPALIEEAKNAVLETIDQNGARLTINGVYAKLPAGDYTVAESWSGDIVGAQWYLPKGVDWDVLGYWRPEPGRSMTDNDLIAIPSGATNPRLAHEFINFFLDERVAYDNFRYWNGYQPPLTSIEPDKLIADGVVPPNMPMAVVSQDMFAQDLTPYELPPEVDQLWQAAWTEITS
ncbi:MAG TPA: spermidine/putrescine ABC transporter substrate-binding protein [Actinomycetota bacterium]|nr:spermidine/putrescine ABC transporter substrate-binding protein [Actinomycetota bacterium]